MKRRQFHCEDSQWAKLAAESKKTGAAISVIIRRALTAYLKK